MIGTAYEAPHEQDAPADTDTPRINVLFPRSVHGLCKIAEIVLSLITLICIGSAVYNASSTSGWLNFVASITLVLSSIFFLLYLFHLMSKLPGPWVIIEFAILTVSCVLFVLSMIIAAAAGRQNSSGAIATAIFCAFSAIAYGVECFLRFRVYKENNSFIISSTGVSTSRKPRHTTESVASFVAQQNRGDPGSQSPKVPPQRPSDDPEFGASDSGAANL